MVMPDQWGIDCTPATTVYTRYRIDCFSHISEADAEARVHVALTIIIDMAMAYQLDYNVFHLFSYSVCLYFSSVRGKPCKVLILEHFHVEFFQAMVSLLPFWQHIDT